MFWGEQETLLFLHIEQKIEEMPTEGGTGLSLEQKDGEVPFHRHTLDTDRRETIRTHIIP
jgi:hypothetical protein